MRKSRHHIPRPDLMDSLLNPPNTESDKSIDVNEILMDLVYTSHLPDDHRSTVDELIKSAKDQLYSLLMDVIGEDEDEDILSIDDACSAQDRNELRAEQRQKLNQLFGKEK